MRLFYATTLATIASAAPKALVYRGPAVCTGCAEAVGHLLETSSFKFAVTYAGPNETVDVTSESLAGVQVYAHGGGPDLEDAWKQVSKYKDALEKFVSSGGIYLGFCLGAYLAGRAPGYGFLAPGSGADQETSRPRAQVTDDRDTVVQVDWKGVGTKWAYFQDGAVMFNVSDDNVLARYTSNGDVAASLTRYKGGWVALTGPHPEATEDWYDSAGIKNPDGVHLGLGYSFIQSAMKAKSNDSTAPAATSAATSSARKRYSLWWYT